ncbi:efflux RND transporter periplasmic adaptor subunit [Solimonas soli]|uniref:efflux RND transporter periplasmic adaptor subunit n=1 Tax=Solimonas soli TaxID=413479 RepID=UPI0004805DE5|nr:hypothetical protein [Solimonas soli]
MRVALLLALCALLPLAARAAAEAPLRVQLGKPQQRQLAIVTTLPEQVAARTLPARVLVDPRRRWRAMSDQPGVLEPPAGGFPLAGQRVAAGQVLAWLRPAMSAPERRDLQSARRAEQRDFDLAQVQIRRFDIDAEKDIDISLPTPSIQIVADYHAAQLRGAALDRALQDRVALRAPAAGVLLASLAQRGQLAAPGDALFEGAAAEAIVVELLHEADAPLRLDAACSGATPLRLIGDSYDTTLRAARAVYAADAALAWAPGETVELRVPLARPVLRIPRRSTFERDGRTRVWVHQGSEDFEARAVRTAAFDEQQLEVTDGLRPGDRVVVDAGALLRQVPP